MTLSNDVTMQQKRGLKANLPASAPAGQLLVTTDTNELFVGTGTGVVQVGGGTDGHAVGYSIYNDVQAIYADGLPGALDPQGRDGWYFTNATLGQKINWYYYDPAQFSTTVADFKNGYAIVTLDTDRYPYIAIYTKPTTTSANAASWYKSKRVYSTKSPTQTVTAGKYLIYFGTDPGVYPEIPRLALTETGIHSAGAFAPTETVNLLALNTSSDTGAGNYKFCVHQLGFQTTSVNREFTTRIKTDQTLTFTQSAAATTWTINHFTGRYPSVTTVDGTGTVMMGTVKYLNNNQITVTFSSAVTGSAYLN